ncbi:MAG: hypothetical protein ACEPO8_09000 [Rhodothermaceae bacterium]
MIKKIILFLIMTAVCFAQGGFERKMMDNEKIEQLINSKLISVLNLDEKTSLRFFARRTAHKNRMKELSKEKDSILHALRKQVKNKDGSYFSTIEASLNIESEIVAERNSFIKGLSDILTEEQVASFILFERRLRKEVRNLIMGQRKMRKMHKNMR